MASTSALPGTTILNLPIAIAIDGTEYTPIVQSGTTKRVQTSLLSAGAALANLPFVMASSNSGFPGARTLKGTSPIIITDGGAAQPITVSLSTSFTSTSALPVPSGGTGVTSFTPYTLIAGGTSSTANLQNVASVGSSGQVLVSNGSSALPSFQSSISTFAISSLSVTSLSVSGVINATTKGQLFGSAGGTNATSILGTSDANIILYNFGSNNWSGIGIDSGGQFWIRTGLGGSSNPAALYIDANNGVHTSSAITTGSTFGAGRIVISSTLNVLTTLLGSSVTSNMTAFAGTDQIVGRDTTDTLRNKTFSTSTNAFFLGASQISSASDILNTLGSTPGMIIYHGAAAGLWNSLAAGSSGQFLMNSNSSGTLVWARSTPPTMTVITSTGVTSYTPPSGVLYLIPEFIAGGGGGAGSGTTPGNGGNGGQSAFQSTTGVNMVANGGGGATAAGGGTNTGGTASGGAINKTGGNGQNGSGVNNTFGGNGGISPYGGAGWGGAAGAGTGVAATANSGSGGGGGGVNVTPNGGGGGGSGGYIIGIVTTISSVFTVLIGSGGTPGSSGVGGAAGGAGGTGFMVIREYYN